MFQTAYGAIPQTINYQGFLIDKNTNLPVDTAQDVIFAFYTAETGGSPAYTESRCNVPVSKGRYEIEIGMSGGIPASIFQNNTSVWMEIQIDPDNSCSGSYEALSPRIKMQSAGYAFEALHASTASAASPSFAADTITTLPATSNGGITISSNVLINGYATMAGFASVPPAQRGRIYFDSNANGALKISLDGSNFVSLATGTAIGMSQVIANTMEFSGDGNANPLKLLASSVTLQGNIFNTGENLVKLSAGLLPAVDASNLFNLRAAQIASGTFGDSRVSISTAAVAGSWAASRIAAGTLPADVLASSIAAGAINSPSQIANGVIYGQAIADSTITLNKFHPSGCANGQIAKIVGGVWACGNDDGGSSYVADEASLQLSGNIFSAKPSSVTLMGNMFNAGDYLVKLEAGKLPALPIYVDSPLSVNVTNIFRMHPECFDKETRRQIENHHDPFGFSRLTYVLTAEDSKKLNKTDDPCIIISASGMCEGGRVLHHLRNSLGDPRNMVLIVGFQAQGTLGKRLVDESPSVRIFGEEQDVRAEIKVLNGFSAHADRNDLIDFVDNMKGGAGKVFLVHGEEAQSQSLAQALRETGREVLVPDPEQKLEL